MLADAKKNNNINIVNDIIFNNIIIISAIATTLSIILIKIITNSEDQKTLKNLLSFGPAILAKPAKGSAREILETL